MRWLFLSILAQLVFAAPSWGCSTDSSYKIPTNFELVQESTVIVIARVKDVPAVVTAPEFEKPSVTLEPIRFLKGSARADQLRLVGWQAPTNWSGVTTPTTLAQSHWSAGLGACIRQFYKPGELVVAMFRSDPKLKKITGLEITQLFEPFARAVETVDSQDDVWPHAVEMYVALQTGPSATLNDRIKQAIGKFSSKGTAEAQAIADDLSYQLTRKDPENVWTNFSTPMSTVAGPSGHGDILLYCLAGTPPGILVTGKRPPRIDVRVGGMALTAEPASPSPVEQKMLESPLDRVAGRKEAAKSLFHFADAHAAIAALQRTTGPVEIAIGDHTPISGRPLDALLRWGAQCEKLQALPAPTEDDLARKLQ